MTKEVSVDELAAMVANEFAQLSASEKERFLAIEQRLSRIEALIEKWNKI